MSLRSEVLIHTYNYFIVLSVIVVSLLQTKRLVRAQPDAERETSYTTQHHAVRPAPEPVLTSAAL